MEKEGSKEQNLKRSTIQEIRKRIDIEIVIDIPEQFDQHRAQNCHYRPKNHKGGYTDPTSRFHPCIPVFSLYNFRFYTQLSAFHGLNMDKPTTVCNLNYPLTSYKEA